MSGKPRVEQSIWLLTSMPVQWHVINHFLVPIVIGYGEMFVVEIFTRHYAKI